MITKNNQQKKVIWVTGMGGLGKTTLTKKVFDNQRIKNHFKCTLWITVSQNFDIANFLINMAKQILTNGDVEEKGEYLKKINDLREKGEEYIVNYVKSELKINMYLLVLDDLWSIHAWNTIENMFSDGKDSCVIVTTRNIDVARYCTWKFKHIFPLKYLSDQDSLDLLLRKMNKSNNFFYQDENIHLKDVIDRIIKKCGGLPLAIVTLGGLLASKPINKEEWKKVSNRLGSELETNPSTEAIKQILDLSYTDLQNHLKPCLLYLSTFPKDYEIRRCNLVHRWIAEGFVRARAGMTLEEVAEGYFYELLNISLIQPSKIGDDGIIKRCRVHDIMHELIVAKSIEENLIFIADESYGEVGKKDFRHFVVLPDSKDVLGVSQPNIRSVSIFDEHVPDPLFSPPRCKMLRVLYMKSLDFLRDTVQFIKYVRRFVHLKCLTIERSTDAIELLKFIGTFPNLQTLELWVRKQVTKRINITKLQQLWHLLIGKARWELGIPLDKGLRNLKMLQSLDLIDIKRSHHRVLEEFCELRQLRRLGVTNLNRDHYIKFCASISKLSRLQTLRVRFESEKTVANCDLESVSSPPRQLRCFKVYGWIGKLPTWIPQLSNLAKITIHESRLEDDAIFVLQSPPSLELLYLFHTRIVGEKLIFENNTFPKLRLLELNHVRNVEEVIFKEHSLPQFETLYVIYCDLKAITGIEYLPKLVKLKYTVGNLNLDALQKFTASGILLEVE